MAEGDCGPGLSGLTVLLCRLVCLSRYRLLFSKWDSEFRGVKDNLGSEKSYCATKKYHSGCLLKKKEISVPIVKNVCLLCSSSFKVLIRRKIPYPNFSPIVILNNRIQDEDYETEHKTRLSCVLIFTK